MKLTKEEWKQLSDRIFLTLRPTQHPVAMKFIKTPEEFDEIPGIEFCQNKASTCKLIGMAAHFQGTFGVSAAGAAGTVSVFLGRREPRRYFFPLVSPQCSCTMDSVESAIGFPPS